MICIVGITHNAVLLDEKNNVLRPSILYTDSRAVPQSEFIFDKWKDKVFERTWNQVGPLWTWPQLLWVKENEPEIWGKVKRILFPKDYVRYCLSEVFVTDTIDPEGTLLFDPVKNEWITEFTDTLDLGRDCWPKPLPSLETVGEITTRAAEITGLSPGTPLICGTTDTAAEVFGVGALQPGQATIKLASVGRITAVSKTPIPYPNFLNYSHVINGLWYPGTSTKFAATAFSWARKAFWNESDESFDYKVMDQAASTAPPGSGGMIFHPHLAGEFAPHWDPQLLASFLGVSINHTRAHFTRAVMEGVGFAIRDALEDLIEAGAIAEEIRLIGGGTASSLWAQIISDIIRRDLIVPESTDAAFGSALLAGIAAGFFENSPKFIHSLIQIRDHLTPNTTYANLYDDLFSIYRLATKATRDISHKLNRFQAD